MPQAAMMMINLHMNKRFVSVLLFLFVSFGSIQRVTGQQNDFQCWPSLQLNVEVIKNLKFQIEEELRLYENASQIDKQINDIGLSYRINKFIKTALFYRLAANWKNPDEYEWRNGLYADLSFSYDLGRFSLGYRLRMQSSNVDLRDSESELFNGIRNRHKFSVEYDLKGIPLVPFAEGELFSHLGGSEGYSLIAYRAWAGLNYTLNKKHELGLKFGIDQELNVPDPLRAYVIALSYTLNLKLASVE